jgi:ATP-dependent Zn protease
MGWIRRRQSAAQASPNGDVQPTAPAEYRSRQRDEERLTRKPLALWDRIKLLLLLAVAASFMLSANITSAPPLQVQFLDNPLVGIADAIQMDLGTYVVMAVLAGLEVIRQLHYLVSEHWSHYHLFWSRKVFGRFDLRRGRMDDWTRYRVQRMFRIGFLLIIADLVLASVFNLPVATALIEAPGALLGVLPMALRLVFGFFFVIVQFVGLFWFLSRGGVDVYFPDDIKTRFTDVWGQDNVLEKIKENMVFLEDPERIEARGGYVPGGILLWGPPGTGKTLMAEAVAGETGKPFVFVDPGAFTNMFMGVGILKVKSLFRKARKLALRYGGVILFFDEADSLGSRGALAQPPGGGYGMSEQWAQFGGCNGLTYLDPSTAAMVWHAQGEGERQRAGGRGSQGPTRDGIIMGGMGGGGGGMGTLNALLTELSGLKKPRGFFNRVVRRALGLRPKPPPRYRIMVMMATNLPQALDEALLRPGRIDRIYKVGYPSKVGRIRTYQGYFDKVPRDLSDADLDKLATITPYATGASMKDLVNESLINALRAGREIIIWADVVKAKHLKELGPPEDVEYIERERHAVAVHEACHAVMAYRVRQHLTIDIATIEKGGTYLGMVASIPPEDQFTRWRSEYESDILVSLASLAGERLFFDGDNSSGVSGDLESATRVATMMEGYWGMGSTVASHGVTRQAGIPGGRGGPGGDDDRERDLLSGDLGARIETKLASLLTKAEDLLRENRHAIFAVAHALERHKTVTGDDVRAIIDGTAGPLVDGRPYHTETFQEAAESYHERLAEAHRAHATPDVPLPEFPELVTVAASADGQATDNGQTPSQPDRDEEPAS